MGMIQAVVIDVDDTLCLTEAACFDLENEVLKRMGREPMPRAIHPRRKLFCTRRADSCGQDHHAAYFTDSW